MYNYNISQLSKLILEIFTANSNAHKHNTRSSTSCLHTLSGRSVKLPIAHLDIEVVIIWNHISKRLRIDVFYSKFK